MSKYNKGNARGPEQLAKMQELEKLNKCFMCYTHLTSDTSINPIEHESEHWVVRQNDYPYKGTKLHLLFIPKRHVKSIGDLSVHEANDMVTTIAYCQKIYNLDAYSVGIRNGDMTKTGGTVEHLHGHIVVGDTADTTNTPVRFKMSS